MRIALLLLGVMAVCRLAGADDWPQAAGPNGNFVVQGKAPHTFSVAKNENVLWRTPLPNTGQGTVIVSGGRAFVTSHAPITKDSASGALIQGLCFDAGTGKELWRRDIPGTRVTDLSSLFSDNTAASPVATGTSVCFTNVGGTVKCFDFSGKQKWSYTWTPFGRHHARQHEPMLFRDRIVLMHAPRHDLPASATTKAGAKPLGRDRNVWTYLQAYNLTSGRRAWIAKSATSVHSTSILGPSTDGSWSILTGRGGGHQPPEEPYGSFGKKCPTC
jgi:outer membrane protein assembly factor BamB